MKPFVIRARPSQRRGLDRNRLRNSLRAQRPPIAGVLTIAALLLVFGSTDRALAADSHAPPGAPINWLPPDGWVNEHWLPYDRNLLLHTLHMNTADVRQFFAAHATPERIPPLARRVRARGLSVSGLARRLVRAGLPHASGEHRAELLKRARWTLTQGHLMQHMLFHPFHDRALFLASQRIFGVSPEELGRRVNSGRSRRQIGHAHGRSDRQMVAATEAVLRAEQRKGVASDLTPRSEARAELSSQLSGINAFLDARRRTKLDFPRKAGDQQVFFCHGGGG